MAFPSVRATTYVEEPSDTKSHDVDLTGVAAGDRLILFALLDNDGTSVTISGMPTGWSEITVTHDTSGGGGSFHIYEKLDASGGEPSFTYSSSSNQKSRNRLFMVSGSHSTQALEAATWVGGTAVNPPQVVPSWGPDDNLWIAFYAVDQGRGKALTYPTNYDDNQYTYDSLVSDTTNVNYGVATRELNAASEDPDAFTKNSTDSGRTTTLVIRPSVSTTLQVGRAVETNTARVLGSGLGLSFPSSPTGLTAVAPAPSAVELAWTAVTDQNSRPVGYDIRRQKLDGPGGSPVGAPIIIEQDYPTNDYVDSNVEQETTYEYEVRASIVIRPTVGQVEEDDTAISLVGITQVQVGRAVETNTARVLSFSLTGGGGGGFGAGAPAAPLAVPGNAVFATPSTLASLINANPGGTNFELAPGTYNGGFPNKAGNGYFGQNYLTVVFDGGATYPNLNDGTTATGGTPFAFTFTTNNTLANVTLQKYIGVKQGDAAFNLTAAAGNLIRNVLAQHNQYAGLDVGKDTVTQWCTSRYNGQYGFHGSPIGGIVENCDIHDNADGAMKAQGLTPRFGTGDRGACKMIQTNGATIRNNWFHDGWKGLWFDGIRQGAISENNLIERFDDFGIFYEIGGGTAPDIIRNNEIIDCATFAESLKWTPAVIKCSAAGGITIEDNNIHHTGGGIRNGIIIRQMIRPGLPVEKFSSSCGTTIQNNTILGPAGISWVGVHQSDIVDGCDIYSTPSNITITNNNEVGGTPTFLWQNTVISQSAWNALGYS